MIPINKITNVLDEYFKIDSASKDMPFSEILPQIYSSVQIDINKYFYRGFFRNFLGLMIKNSDNVEKIYGMVFLNNDIIGNLLNDRETDVLIFTHHPAENETAARGFLPLEKSILDLMKFQRISVYSLHSPLDYNNEISTTGSLVKRLRLNGVERFIQYGTGFIGMCGELESEISYEDFILMVKNAVGVDKINSIKYCDKVKRIGVVPGGGTDIRFIETAMELGCDTYLTGEYYNKLKISFGDIERKLFNEKKDSFKINLVEASHHATEKLVMTDDFPVFFKKHNFPYFFLDQNNPWY